MNKTLHDHNSGKNLSTMSKKPWTLLYKEEFKTLADASSREKHFKSSEGNLELKSKGIL
jgi:predicted GIY-YIG superfamily endonuclease